MCLMERMSTVPFRLPLGWPECANTHLPKLRRQGVSRSACPGRSEGVGSSRSGLQSVKRLSSVDVAMGLHSYPVERENQVAVGGLWG